MKHFRVRNWTKFQHYKKRNPPWIKLHTELLDNYEFSRLQDASKLLAMCICLLAARCDNRIPADAEWIQRKCSLKSKPDIAPLIDGGFVEWIQELPNAEQVASAVLADCKQSATSETEERQRRDASASALAPVKFNPQEIPGLNVEAWGKWLDHRREIKKPIKPHSLQDAAEELAKLGDRQLAEVKRAVANGWQGLYPEKQNTPAKPNPFAGAI